MGETWTSQNKILPGAYINFLTNAPLTITPGDRGIVVLLQEMSVGTLGEIYEVTTLKNNYPTDVSTEDKMLANEALKGAETVLVYNLGVAHDLAAVESALNALNTIKFNVLCYPYSGSTYETNLSAIKVWVMALRNEEGVKVQAALAEYSADVEGIINITQGMELSNGSVLTAAQTTAWVAGITAGARVNQSNTGQRYEGAIDVVPRMTKTEIEEAITAGKFIFKVDSVQNVTAVYDINSFTSITTEKGKQFTKNRVIRTLDGINNDIIEIFESNYIGKVNNTVDGRSILRATLVEYFNELQRLSAIQNFTVEDVTVSEGNDTDAVVIDCYIQPVDSVEKMYITVNLS